MQQKTISAINQKIKDFRSIGLEEMSAVTLMDRTDIKFVVPVGQLPALLARAQDHYRMLEANDKRLFGYETLYYDTPDFAFYHKHHAGHLNRRKIRHRTYVDSNLSFLEVKFKNNKGRTLKTRMESKPGTSGILSEQDRIFLDENAVQERPMELRPKLWVSYDRLTLVGVPSGERITIDLNLTLGSEGQKKSYAHMAIVEVKQEKSRARSEFRNIMRWERIMAGGMSKYCLGVATMYPDVKCNRFKQQIRRLERLRSPASSH